MLRSHELLVLFIQFNLCKYFSNFRYLYNSTLYKSTFYSILSGQLAYAKICTLLYVALRSLLIKLESRSVGFKGILSSHSCDWCQNLPSMGQFWVSDSQTLGLSSNHLFGYQRNDSFRPTSAQCVDEMREDLNASFGSCQPVNCGLQQREEIK